MSQTTTRKLKMLEWIAKVTLVLSINTLVTLCILFINGIINQAGFAFGLILDNIVFLLSLAAVLTTMETGT